MIRAERISSAQNLLLKRIRRAVRTSGVTEDGLLVAEGFHLLEEAVRSERPPAAVVCTEEALPRALRLLEGLGAVRVAVAPRRVLEELAATECSQGVITLAAIRKWRLEDVWGERPLVLVLDGIQDPGNAGTMVRSAEAFGASGALFLRGSVSAYNSKAVRASAGSVFRLPVVTGLTATEVLTEAAARGITVYTARSGVGIPADAADLVRPCVLVVGSEARGVSSEFRSQSAIRIPVQRVESLNAAMAAGILLYEASRQRGGLA